MRSLVVFRIAINTLVFLLFACLFSNILQVLSWQSAIISAIILAVTNQLVKPLIQLISLPITVLTLGLFSIAINGLNLSIIDYLADGFSINGFGWSVVLSVVLSISNIWLQSSSKTRLF